VRLRQTPQGRRGRDAGRLTVAARIIICCALVLALVGCAGNQTGFDMPAVDGTFGDVGNTIALRDVLIPNPRTPHEVYPTGPTVPVLLAIVNKSKQADGLVGVTSSAASQVLLHDHVAPADELRILLVNQHRCTRRSSYRILGPLNESQQVTYVEVCESL
jgi:hypothetical protein